MDAESVIEETFSIVEKVRKGDIRLGDSELFRIEYDRENREIFAPHTEFLLKSHSFHGLLTSHPLIIDRIDLQRYTLIRYKPYVGLSKKTWCPMSMRALDSLLPKLELNERSVFYSLGCGDARECIRAAEFGAKASGYEINYTLIDAARELINHYTELTRKMLDIEIIEENFFDCDISKATHIFFNAHKYSEDKRIDDILSNAKTGTKLLSVETLSAGWTQLDEFRMPIVDYQPSYFFSVYLCERK